jgi:hypothetical protein
MRSATAQAKYRAEHPERVKETQRACYQRNRAAYLANMKARQQEHRDRLRAIKLERGCADCGYNAHACALDFDHVRGEKFMGVARMIGRTWATIEAEVAKCDVVCANCHRVRTEERNEYVG